MVRWNSGFRGLTLAHAAVVGATLLISGLVGCGGSTGGDGQELSGDGFVSSDSTTGKVALNTPSTLQVGDSQGFSVSVVNASGAGVGDVPVICDTEGGLALIEPNDGTEGTDGNGSMSGIVGCLQPGSYRIGCRALNKREFQTIVCSGEIPAGFAGFPGAGGGTLGGGSSDDGDADPDVSVVSLDVFDVDPDAAAFTIDTVQNGDCSADGSATTDDVEQFVENFWTASFTSTSGKEAKITSWSLSVPQAAGAGSADYNSGDLEIFGIIPPKTDSASPFTISGLLTTGTTGGKTFVGRSVVIPSIGFRNVTFRFKIAIENADGTTTVLNKSIVVGINFNNIDNCSN
jgi:hypothetical protein